jgi:hypothetical protein
MLHISLPIGICNFFRSKFRRPEPARQRNSAERPSNRTSRGAGYHFQDNTMRRDIGLAARLLPLLEGLEQEIEHAGGIGARRYRARQRQPNLERVR